MKLHTLLSSLASYTGDVSQNPTITSIENDNRLVQPGSLFVCVKGYTVDGHDFAEAAVASGAAAIVAEKPLSLSVPVIVVKDTYRAMAMLADKFYEHPTQKLKLIGITGTNGKTTISHLIEKLLSDDNKKTGLIGTMYTKIADKIFETKNTTPDSVTLQKTFHAMAEEGVDAAVMEVSSHALELGRVHGCDYDLAIFTNLTQDHLDFHKTMERYKFAKSLLFSQLGNAYYDDKRKYAIINVDDEAAVDLISYTAAHVVTYGIDQDADVRATDIEITSSGTTFMLHARGEKLPMKLQLVGKFSVYNVLAAVAAGLCLNLKLPDIIASLEEVKGVSGRFELVNEGQDYTVIVDYAHTPDSLENVMKTVNEFAKGNTFVVVGCGGDRDKTKRPIMANIACEYATYPIFTSDNPRTEKPEDILKDMEAGVAGKSYTTIIDRKEAIYASIKQAKPGDVIVIAGKGHETYQEIGKQRFDFDDRVIARQAIQEQL
ncbi:UDP-N-acetylmuramoyl-L-alanyl-D-glutamate--2,6-diaminopimelate ligase [Bacillus sp. AGMB 02131]|uniref:UDP-N-acetylmuramoyl-L-alanyl-D-glutamate--2,6-diaminopimelate ligase n=1 Tax=Peribacillus faecalis TaxID=2772559 RepID=A0A927CVP6_9BACI|nr:UDP-N-acetylmuramoyl-L-alanyl-D-glutamate--2,6-diaminopimelate ligase [Peribacillus faecalis]MBD3106825.1 UDP-N-acetylmuramoyl-L-alanyl-D-glutamate--2,6-diaminopimelate ligase [Peribacillus faecalis]